MLRLPLLAVFSELGLRESSVCWLSMKKITLSADEDLIARARLIASLATQDLECGFP
jgi:hypothetical protein